MSERYAPERIWIDTGGTQYWYDSDPEYGNPQAQTEEYVRANGCYGCASRQRRSKGVVVEVEQTRFCEAYETDFHDGLIIRAVDPEMRIEDGTYRLTLTRIEEGN